MHPFASKRVYQRCAGFSLIETALAMLVAAVGLTAIIMLMPTAMDQGKKAADETAAAFFADTVFNSFLAANYSTNVAWSELTTYETIPPASINGGQDVMWKDSQKMTVKADGLIHTQRFVAIANNTAGSAGLYDHALRFQLTMTDVGARRRALDLLIWPGEFGTTNNPFRFASELFNHGYN